MIEGIEYNKIIEKNPQTKRGKERIIKTLN